MSDQANHPSRAIRARTCRTRDRSESSCATKPEREQ